MADPEPAKARDTRVNLRSLLPYLREHRFTLLAVAVLSLVTAGGTLLQPLLTRSVLDRVGRDPVGRHVALLVAALLIVAGLDAFRDYLLKRTAEGLVLSSRRRLAGHLLRLPITEYDRRRTGDLLSRVGADTTLLRAVVTSGLFETVTGVVMVVGAATAMVLLDLVLFGVTVGALAIGLAAGFFFGRRVRVLTREAQERIGEMTAAVERAISAARTIRASRAEDRETATVSGHAGDAYHAGLRIARLQAMVAPAMTVAIQGAFLLVLATGGARVASGAISVGDLVAFVLFLFFLVIPLGQALNAYTQLQAGLGALTRIEEVLRLPRETDDEQTLIPGPRPAPNGSGAAPGLARSGLRSTVFGTREDGASKALGPAPAQAGANSTAVDFERVSFGYDDGVPILREVSFTVPAGTRTALVGPSGAGKSTLLALVERFYEVDSGTIRVSGVDIRAMPREELRRQLGYVEQEAPVLAGTLRENLRLTVPDATDEDMLAVLARVNLTDIVTRTDSGLDAQVGEGGVLLSGGERQRLAIARTLLAAPPILLLDEPTSNLDARNEAALRSAINAVAERRTLLIVAHRLSTVVDSDQIVVLDQGRVLATGPHHELLETSDLYRELATHQLLVPETDVATPESPAQTSG